MAKTFAVSGQHYLFNVQAFAHTILAEGGESYNYALRDRTTRQVIADVAAGTSELGVVVQTSTTKATLDQAFAEAGVTYTALAESSPMVALGASHPYSNASSLTLEELEVWPYLRFEQEDDNLAFAEEALSEVARKKVISLTDRASLSELATAVNGYTITSGILVGITDSGSLTTIPLKTDIRLTIGVIVKKDAELSPMGQRFLKNLEKSLKLYAK